SRGAIMCFSGAFLFFLLALFIKFPSKVQMISMITIFLIVAGFLLYAGNLKGVWKELQTVEGEFGEGKESLVSFDANREGARRAMAIYRAYPFWGVGTWGYDAVAKKFATPGTYDEIRLIKFRIMCHYLTILAEEGIGAFVYYLFLLAYFYEILIGLIKTKSRFQFVSCLSLFAAVIMVLAHAGINHLMQNWTTAMLAYIFMGASLGILRRDFQHQP
ncbi:MAG: hypothetical protein PHN49_08465, partial [Candidatus Omnitrophica bacterium]|nr:hypothetical protein [Candidatus Omnitrophota bacterium]